MTIMFEESLFFFVGLLFFFILRFEFPRRELILFWFYFSFLTTEQFDPELLVTVLWAENLRGTF